MSEVKAFGAKGDGVADDTDAIRHAVEFGDGDLRFSRGVYRISKTIEVPLSRLGRQSISGEGGVASILMDGPGPALRLVGTHDKSADPQDFRQGVWDRERMPTLSGIEILGGHERSIGVEIEGVMMATLAGVLIRRCLYGVRLFRRNRNILISHCHIYHGRPGGIGIYFDRVNLHQSIIVGSHVSYHSHAGIKVEASEVRNLQITGCDIEYNFDPDRGDSADVWIDSREGTVREVTIASNTIQAKNSPAGANIRVEGAELDGSTKAGLLTIVGNVLQSQETNVLMRSCRGINVTGNSFASGYSRSLVIDKCRNIVVSANTLDYNPDYTGDRVDGITVRESSGITLSSMVLEQCRSGSPERGGAIEVVRSRDVGVLGCQIFDPLHRGIDFEDVQNGRIADCSVTLRRNEPSMLEAVRVAGESRNNLVTNNLLARGKRSSLEFAPGAGIVSGTVIL